MEARNVRDGLSSAEIVLSAGAAATSIVLMKSVQRGVVIVLPDPIARSGVARVEILKTFRLFPGPHARAQNVRKVLAGMDERISEIARRMSEVMTAVRATLPVGGAKNVLIGTAAPRGQNGTRIRAASAARIVERLWLREKLTSNDSLRT